MTVDYLTVVILSAISFLTSRCMHNPSTHVIDTTHICATIILLVIGASRNYVTYNRPINTNNARSHTVGDKDDLIGTMQCASVDQGPPRYSSTYEVGR
jgi:hypothetical protein